MQKVFIITILAAASIVAIYASLCVHWTHSFKHPAGNTFQQFTPYILAKDSAPIMLKNPHSIFPNDPKPGDFLWYPQDVFYKTEQVSGTYRIESKHNRYKHQACSDSTPVTPTCESHISKKGTSYQCASTTSNTECTSNQYDAYFPDRTLVTIWGAKSPKEVGDIVDSLRPLTKQDAVEWVMQKSFKK